MKDANISLPVATNDQYAVFKHISSNTERVKARNFLFQVTGKSGKAFNYFVIASIDFFYRDGNKQINIVNDLLKIAHQSKGMNSQRLGAYLKQVVPHEMIESVSHKSPPVFGKRLKGKDYLSLEDVQSFIDANPEWCAFGRVAKTTDFDREKYLKAVVAHLKREGENVRAFATDILLSEAG